MPGVSQDLDDVEFTPLNQHLVKRHTVVSWSIDSIISDDLRRQENISTDPLWSIPLLSGFHESSVHVLFKLNYEYFLFGNFNILLPSCSNV